MTIDTGHYGELGTMDLVDIVVKEKRIYYKKSAS